MKSKFQFSIPVEFIQKGDDWRIKGICSTEDKDLQGEIVKQGGLDWSHIEKGLGLFNWNHKNDPQYILGKIDTYNRQGDKTEVEGYLFPYQENAKAVYNIMKSLKPEDKGRVQMSIEGKVMQREGADKKVVKAARVEKIALTVDAINQSTYTNFAKAFTSGEDIEKDDDSSVELELKSLRKSVDEMGQLMQVMSKALATGDYSAAPGTLEGGAAIQGESLEGSKKKKKVKKDEDAVLANSDVVAETSGEVAADAAKAKKEDDKEDFETEHDKKEKKEEADEKLTPEQQKEKEKKVEQLQGKAHKCVMESPTGRTLYKSILVKVKKEFPDCKWDDIVNFTNQLIEKKLEKIVKHD